MFGKFKISCDEATTICDKAQYGEATTLEKIKLNMHVMFCKICRLYSKQNGILTGFYKKKATECRAKKHLMTDEDKLALKEKIKEII
ncbi:hypothetical protein [Tenacibaculum xiamenense]|uniref:hypothetical protein n=1 Tax=Tenacibaculum xiamenense TaxID=1261553 RepID=UPI003894FF70